MENAKIINGFEKLRENAKIINEFLKLRDKAIVAGMSIYIDKDFCFVLSHNRREISSHTDIQSLKFYLDGLIRGSKNDYLEYDKHDDKRG